MALVGPLGCQSEKEANSHGARGSWYRLAGTQDPSSLAAVFAPLGRQYKKEANAHGARGSRYGLAGMQDRTSSAALFGPPGRQHEKEANAHGARGLWKGLTVIRAHADATSDQEAHSEANQSALMKGAGRKAAAERKKSPERGRPIVRGRLAVDDSSNEESDGKTVTDRDLAALRAIADNRNLRGTTASRLCQAAKAVQARPGWSGMGMHYTAWVNALGRNPSSPEAALGTIAPELAYLVRKNGKLQFFALHHIHQWRSPDVGASVCTTALWFLKVRCCPITSSPPVSF